MDVARRLYLYLIAGITLAMLVGALISLLNIALESILGGAGNSFGFDPAEARRSQLSLVLATIGVALPVWAIHWGLAERSLRPSALQAEAERRSALRGLYLATVMFGLLVVLMVSGAALVRWALTAALGASAGSGLILAEALGALVIAGGFWGYHSWVAVRDARRPMAEAAAWLPRLYRYVATFIGLMTLLYGVVQVVGLAGESLAQSGGILIGSSTRPSELATVLATIVVGFAVWAGHWWWTNRVVRNDDWRGLSERTARNRYGYLVLVIVVAAGTAISQFAMGLRDVLLLTLAETSFKPATSLLDTAGVIVFGLVFGGVWWAHRRFMIAEAGELSADHQMSARRVDAYVAAALGLSAGATGLAWLIGEALEMVLGGSRRNVFGAGSHELATFLGYTAVGSIVWLAQIGMVARWRSRLASDEARSTARRAYLLLAIAGALLGGVGALVVLLNRLFGSLLGVEGPRNLASELATPLGVLIMAALVAGLHFAWLRRDQALVTSRSAVLETPRSASTDALSTGTSASAPAVQLPAERRLILTGPAGADLTATVDDLRGGLPEGYRLEEAD